MHKKAEFQTEKVQYLRGKSSQWWWDGWTQRQAGWRTRELCFCLWCRGEKSNQPCVIQSGEERCTFAGVCRGHDAYYYHAVPLFSPLTHTEEVNKLLLQGASRAADLATLSRLLPIGWLTFAKKNWQPIPSLGAVSEPITAGQVSVGAAR